MTNTNKLSPSDYEQSSAEEIKQEILRKLDEIDLELITHLSGSLNFPEDAEQMNGWNKVIWTVWNR